MTRKDLKNPAGAVIITNGFLCHSDGKTAHGLIRGSSRYTILAVLDQVHAGRDAGELLDDQHRGIPVFGSVSELMEQTVPVPQYAIIGVALDGGILPDSWKSTLLELLAHGVSLVSGLHSRLEDDSELMRMARDSGAEIIDIRKPKPVEALHFFSGAIYQVTAPRVAVLGTDCAVGKRTTCRLLMEMCRQHSIKTEMIYTGQTGWLQGFPYGFILDATPNDFVSGELEQAIVQCASERDPDLILLEGQSALRNPHGPCGAEFILSGHVRQVILQHAPFRPYFENLIRPECRIPTVQQEIELIKCYGAETIAVCLNGEGGTVEELNAYHRKLEQEIGIPVIQPLRQGLAALLQPIRQIAAQKANDPC